MATDHHYVPQGYLKRWANPISGKVTSFQHAYKGLLARPSATAGTGYKKHLYTATLNPEVGDILETELLQRIDSDGAKLLERFTTLGRIELNPDERSAWNMFLLSLLHRSPARVEHFNKLVAEEFPSFAEGGPPGVAADYEVYRRPGDPPTVEEFFRNAADKDVELGKIILLRQLFTSDRMGEALNAMTRAVIHFKKPKHELLTSDRPLIMTNGLGHADAVVLLALSPNHLFIAAHTDRQIEPYNDPANRDAVIKGNNEAVCRQAERYVYSTGTAQASFVEKYFPRPLADGVLLDTSPPQR